MLIVTPHKPLLFSKHYCTLLNVDSNIKYSTSPHTYFGGSIYVVGGNEGLWEAGSSTSEGGDDSFGGMDHDDGGGSDCDNVDYDCS